jgi:hypothetical protein
LKVEACNLNVGVELASGLDFELADNSVLLMPRTETTSWTEQKSPITAAVFNFDIAMNRKEKLRRSCFVGKN